jgi:hypothetical protein
MPIYKRPFSRDYLNNDNSVHLGDVDKGDLPGNHKRFQGFQVERFYLIIVKNIIANELKDKLRTFAKKQICSNGLGQEYDADYLITMDMTLYTVSVNQARTSGNVTVGDLGTGLEIIFDGTHTKVTFVVVDRNLDLINTSMLLSQYPDLPAILDIHCELVPGNNARDICIARTTLQSYVGEPIPLRRLKKDENEIFEILSFFGSEVTARGYTRYLRADTLGILRDYQLVCHPRPRRISCQPIPYIMLLEPYFTVSGHLSFKETRINIVKLVVGSAVIDKPEILRQIMDFLEDVEQWIPNYLYRFLRNRPCRHILK